MQSRSLLIKYHFSFRFHFSKAVYSKIKSRYRLASFFRPRSSPNQIQVSNRLFVEAPSHARRSDKNWDGSERPHKGHDPRPHPTLQQTSQLCCEVLDELPWTEQHLGQRRSPQNEQHLGEVYFKLSFLLVYSKGYIPTLT